MDAKITLGRAIRQLRDGLRLSQEKLAEQAGITYQYLSSIENGKENFTVGILEALAKGLGTAVAPLVAEAYLPSKTSLPKINPGFFVPGAPLPPGMNVAHLEKVLNDTQMVFQLINSTLIQVTERPLSGYVQANNFSGIVSNILCDAFSRFSPYKHNLHQKYPDLVCESGNSGPATGLEVKTTIRPGKGGESHNGHSGWHVVACFNVNADSGDICFLHVMFANLIGYGKADADWQYVKSIVNAETGSQRTETYMTTPEGTARLRHGTVYLDTEKLDVARWRTHPQIPIPSYSLFQARIARKNSKKVDI